jgi:hypothetical protein
MFFALCTHRQVAESISYVDEFLDIEAAPFERLSVSAYFTRFTLYSSTRASEL